MLIYKTVKLVITASQAAPVMLYACMFLWYSPISIYLAMVFMVWVYIESHKQLIP